MSSFKKLRLDPELPPTHRNQVGANDGGRGFMDGSSFSSSTSGGSGAYGRNTGPFRTRYSQPMGGGSASPGFSRFAPYYFGKERRTSVRVPLIRARRDDSDSEGCRPSSRASLNSSLGGDSTASATSSTAQRIIETLQNLSTPVMNAGKIRIDQDIKAIPPLSFGGGASISRISPGGIHNRSTGPPKMCSSLLLTNPSPANQTSPIYNVGEQRRLFCIPKMVDAATNTEKEEIRSPAPSSLPNKSSPIVANKPTFLAASLKPSTSTPANKEDNSEDEQDSKFTFSTPWAPTIFDRFLKNPNEDKSTAKGLSNQAPLMNGFKDVPQSSSSLSKPFTGGISSTSTSTPFSGLKSTIAPVSSFSGSSSGFGTSPMKDVSFGKSQSSSGMNADSFKSSNSGDNNGRLSTGSGFNFGQSPVNTPDQSKKMFGSSFSSKGVLSKSPTSVDKVDAPKSDSIFTSKSSGDAGSKSTLPPLSTLPKSKSAKWRCPTCMVDNDATVSACLCCGEKNINQQPGKASADKEVKKKWRCPTCMVENEVSAANCVCCSDKNPNPVPAAAASTSISVPVSKKWRCSTCMVENEASVANCVCCSEKNPNPTVQSSTPAAGPAATPAFSFGVPNSTATATTNSKSSFVFGAGSSAGKESTSSASSDFKFGVTATSNAATSSTPAAAPSPTPGFKFGAASATSSSAPTTFGFPSTPAKTSQPATAANTTLSTTPAFTPAKTPDLNSTAPASGTGGIFGASSFTPAQPTSNSFKFGSTPAPEPSAGNNETQKPVSAPFTFGATAATKPAFNSFSFTDRPQSSPSPAPAASTPAPVAPALGGAPAFAFGANANNSGNATFGLAALPKNPPQPTGGFTFGNSTANPPTPSLATTPSFALTPNLNFGATPGSSIPFGNPTQPTPTAGSQPPPALFQFNATPTESPGGRKIKRAVRRFNK